MPTRREIAQPLQAAKQRAMTQFLLAPRARRVVHRISARPEYNLVGVGVGPKFVKGRATKRPSVRLYVMQKLDRELVPPEHSLPEAIDGIETDVVAVGHLRAQILSSRKRHRPAKPGCSIGFQLAGPNADILMAGTLGAVVARGGKRFILSNNHVLANENALPVGTAICQPGVLDHGEPAGDTIAQLADFVPLTAAGPNRVDCAIAEIPNPALVGTRLLPRLGKLASAEPIDAAEGMSVEKVGRGTGQTTGTVYDVSADITLSYDLGDLTFVDQILIHGTPEPFSDYGDSGALVVDSDSGRATGLLIGGSEGFAIANHLEDVLSELGLSLVP